MVCAVASTTTGAMAATETMPGPPCISVVCEDVSEGLEGEVTAAELLMSDANFKEWDTDYTGRGWARHYVNRCFTHKVQVNSRVLQDLQALDALDEGADLPCVWDLSNCYLGRNGVAPVLGAVQLRTGLTRLDLTGCGLDTKALALVVQALSSHPSIQEVVLEDNNLYASAARLAIALLSKNSNVLRIVLPDSVPALYRQRVQRRLAASMAAYKRANPSLFAEKTDPYSTSEVILDSSPVPAAYAVLGRAAYVLRHDGWSDEEVAGAIPPLLHGAGAVVAELDGYVERLGAAVRGKTPVPVLLDELLSLRAELQAHKGNPAALSLPLAARPPEAETVSAAVAADAADAAGAFSDPVAANTLALYAHVRRSCSECARHTPGVAAKARRVASCVEELLRAEERAKRGADNLAEKIKYHTIMRGTRANKVLKRWLGRTALPPDLRGGSSNSGLIVEDFDVVYNRAFLASEYTPEEPAMREEVLSAVRTALPPCLVDFLLHVSVVELVPASVRDALRLLPPDLRRRCVGGHDCTLAVDDLPTVVPRGDFLVHVYELLGVRGPAELRVEEFHAWLRLLPESQLDAYLCDMAA